MFTQSKYCNQPLPPSKIYFFAIDHFLHGFVTETPSFSQWGPGLSTLSMTERERKETLPLLEDSPLWFACFWIGWGYYIVIVNTIVMWIVKTILQDRLTTKTNCEVVQMNWASSGVQVTTCTGEKYSRWIPKQDENQDWSNMLACFSHVAISTVSLGVLKASHKTLFQPALPDQKVNWSQKSNMKKKNLR